jgi:UDP-GlcNAc:undecaprenyl-phosphate GlcNAc-1-phosphate transferase
MTAIGLFALYLSRVRVYDDAQRPAAQGNSLTPLVSEFMYKRRVVEVIADFCLIATAYYVANRLRFDPEAYQANAESFYGSLPIVMAVQLVAFFFVGVYRGEWHVYGLNDAVTSVKGVVLGASAITLLVLALFQYTSDPRMIFVYYGLLLTILMLALRGSLRVAGALLR